MVWSFFTGSFSGLVAYLVAMIDFDSVFVVGISIQLWVVGRRPTAGEPGMHILLETYT